MKNFEFYLPTKVFFGKKALKAAERELPNLGRKVLFVFGRSSIFRTGLYNRIKELLERAGIESVDFGGIKSNPLFSKVKEGIELAKKEGVEFILAVGGGSVIDSAKAIACGVYHPEELWSFYERKAFPKKALPIAAIPTIAGSGSELDNVSVLTHDETRLKISMKSPLIFPKVSFLNPELTLSVPPDYTAYGIVDAFSHFFEVFVSSENKSPCITREVLATLMKSLIYWSKILMKDFYNYEARANIMWISSLGLTDFVRAGVGRYLFVMHAIEHSLSGIYDLPHGLGLAIVMCGWMKRYNNSPALKEFFEKVFEIKASNQKEIFEEGFKAFKEWLEVILKVPTSLRAVQIREEEIPELADKAFQIFKIWGADKYYTLEDVKAILREALN
jgi:alcohol dehydrogenase YqhD (iron-dependent ADH family)